MKYALIISALAAWCFALICITGSFLMPDPDQAEFSLIAGFCFGMIGLVIALINLWQHRRNRN
ncbi:hypothetical protein [Acetobacter oeni]|uniref:Uncharacterized protein n=1 Tax=Acetobacter oeni TaxID=304077 RepID=A0A511XQ69_9PROT|nr:hypothetical protein [Acetobacter oeni]MBB3884721.1 hypothetical protein [Acetobacter oeni]NHO20647.1 hypothetical protein [Acetobacter oeni]GBR04753.1 hypothetical protein AA21952_1517 [Acetobacter oeni LMG 21952]GEN65049.1 hypothetical protein AOE01nite_32730 [Acetobacter oeni]